MKIKFSGKLASVFRDISARFGVDKSFLANSAINTYINMLYLVKDGAVVQCRTPDGKTYDLTRWFNLEKCPVYEFRKQKKQETRRKND